MPSNETLAVRFALICQTPPPEQREGEQTEFGLQDPKQVLHGGSPTGQTA